MTTAPDEFAVFYAAEHRRMVAAMLVVTGDADVAGDATDEAFARALVDWERVVAMASPRGWIYRVALNVVRRRHRRRATEAAALVRRGTPPEELPAPAGELWLVVAGLPERQRTAVLLRYLGDLTEADIARAMGVQRGTVSRMLGDAHRALAAVLVDDDAPVEETT